MKNTPLAVLVVCSLLPVWGALAQLSSAVTEVSAGEAVSRTSVTVSVSLREGHAATSILLLFRPFGTREFRKAEMDLRGSTASSVLPADVAVPPFVEYYIVLTDASGRREAYPRSTSGDPLTTPPPQLLRIAVKEEAEQQVLFLSPDPDAIVNPGDVLISLSLLRADTAVARRATQIKIDDANVTSGAIFSGDLIILAPENLGIQLSPGRHTVKVGLFNTRGQLSSSSELAFYIRRPGAETLLSSPIPQRRFEYDANVQLESRHEDISSTGTWYNRAGAQFKGRTDIWKFTGNLFVTSDEKSDRQPQNRYFVGVETPWVQAGYGDHYPAFPELVLNGKRVRGLQTTARYGILGLDLSLGEISRSVEGLLVKSFSVDSFSVEFKRDSLAAFGQINPTTWGKYNFGTFARKLFAIRPSIGNRHTWEVGFSWLSSGDDMNSVRYGIKPQENILVGTDFMARFDNSRIELTGQAAMTAYNSDISSGNFTDAYIDSVYGTGREGIKTVRDYLKDYITVNDNFRPLSVKELSTLAYQMGLGLEYFDNAFRATYLFRGSDYTSFGQSFLQTDIRGVQLTDRARLIDNQMFLTVGFERLEDNTANTKAATTVFSNINLAATWFPRRELPTVTVGFSRYGNDNSLATNGPDSLSAIADATLRFYIQSSYDFAFGARHTATFNLSTSKRTDESVRKYDLANFTGEVGLTTQYAIPLQTILSIAVYLNTIPGGLIRGESVDLNYTALSLMGRYTLIRDVLILNGSIAPTFGNYRRTAADLGAEWFVRRNMSFQIQGAYFHNDDGSDDSIVSLRYRFTI
jgi:hypothetical protein